MSLIGEISLFIACVCFSVCGALWLFADVTIRGLHGPKGMLFSLLFSVVTPLVVMGIAMQLLNLERTLFALSVPWAVGVLIGIAARLLTRGRQAASA